MLALTALWAGIKPIREAQVARCAIPDKYSRARQVLGVFSAPPGIVPTAKGQSAEAALLVSSRQTPSAAMLASSVIEDDTRLQTSRPAFLVLRVDTGQASMPAHASGVRVAGINRLKRSSHVSNVWWGDTPT